MNTYSQTLYKVKKQNKNKQWHVERREENNSTMSIKDELRRLCMDNEAGKTKEALDGRGTKRYEAAQTHN